MRTRWRLTIVFSAVLLLVSLFSSGVMATAVTQGLAIDETRDLAFSPWIGAVTIVDISDSTNPTYVSGPIQTQGVVQDLFYDEATQLLYIAADEGDLEIWDIQNPSAPQQVSVTPLFYFGVEVPVTSVEVVGDYAYVSTSWGYIHWLDVSDPANPVDFGFNGQGGNPSREVHMADDGFIYLAGPKTVRYSINANGSLSIAGTSFYANSYEVFTTGGYSYITTATGPVGILDASISSMPFVSTYTTSNIKDIVATGDYAYLAHGTTGLRVLDVTDKTNPVEIGFEDSVGISDVIISGSGNTAYVRTGSTFRVIDVTNPNTPTETGSFDTASGGNIAPVANTGLSQAVQSRQRVQLDGSFSYDVDGTIVSYSWEQISGPKVRLRGANTATPRFRAPRVTSYPVVVLTFELTVTDDQGATGTDLAMVTVLPK